MQAMHGIGKQIGKDREAMKIVREAANKPARTRKLKEEVLINADGLDFEVHHLVSAAIRLYDCATLGFVSLSAERMTEAEEKIGDISYQISNLIDEYFSM